MSIGPNYVSNVLAAEIRNKLAAGVPYRTLAEEYGLSRGTIYGLAKGQHGVKVETAREALIQGAQDRTLPVMLRPGSLSFAPEIGRDGWPRVRPARTTDASELGRWIRDYGEVRKSKFADFSSLEKYRGKSVRVIGPNGVERLKLLSDRDAAFIREQAATLDQGDPTDISRYPRSRGRKRVT